MLFLLCVLIMSDTVQAENVTVAGISCPLNKINSGKVVVTEATSVFDWCSVYDLFFEGVR